MCPFSQHYLSLIDSDKILLPGIIPIYRYLWRIVCWISLVKQPVSSNRKMIVVVHLPILWPALQSQEFPSELGLCAMSLVGKYSLTMLGTLAQLRKEALIVSGTPVPWLRWEVRRGQLVIPDSLGALLPWTEVPATKLFTGTFICIYVCVCMCVYIVAVTII